MFETIKASEPRSVGTHFMSRVKDNRNKLAEAPNQSVTKVSYDPLSPSQRSERMKLIRSKNTKVEMKVRRLTHGMGYRYTLHSKALPGSPDLVFPARKKVIFVHGCFWHQHDDCRHYRMPRSNLEFWLPRLQSNRQRDTKNYSQLEHSGWRYLVVWECELKNVDAVASKIRTFLEAS
jgi:DNA mismatch endonuclease, patch repair protein